MKSDIVAVPYVVESCTIADVAVLTESVVHYLMLHQMLVLHRDI